MGVSRLHGKVARAAVAAALTGTMAFSGLLAPAVALATDNMVISSPIDEANEITAYAGYMLFSVDVEKVSDTSSKAVGDATWAPGTAQSKILTVLNTYGYQQWLVDNSYVASNASGAEINEAATVARNALAFISEKIQESSGTAYNFGENGGVRVVNEAKTFAYDLAAALAPVTPNKVAQITGDDSPASTFADLTEGYWLFLPGTGTSVNDFTAVPSVDDPATTGVNESDNFRPIYQFIESTTTAKATRKSATSTLKKQVRGGGTTEWKQYIDAGMGDTIEFQLVGVARKLTQGEGTSELRFTDALPDGLTLTKLSDVHVYAANADGTINESQEITSGFGISSTGAGLVVSSNSANYAQGTYYVRYTTKLNAKANTGLSAFNNNKAVMTFDGQDTTEQSAGVASYKIVLNSIDKATQKKLANTKFKIAVLKDDNATLQVPNGTNGTKAIDADYYLSATGDLVDEINAAEFATDESGTLTAPLVDSGITYTIFDSTPSDGYDTAIANKTADQKTTGLKVKFKAETEILKDQNDNVISDNGKVISLDADMPKDLNYVESSFDAATGTVELTIGSNKTIILPITGMTPSQLGTVMGAALVATGAIAIAMRRRNNAQA